MTRVFRIVLDGTVHEVEVEEIKAGVAAAAQTPSVAAPVAPKAAPKAAPAAPKASGAETVPAPLPGTVLSVNVAAGQALKAGQTLVVIEAMKMENEIVAPRDCTVTAVHVTKGQSISAEDALVDIA